jgi:tellurite resistance protein TerC
MSLRRAVCWSLFWICSALAFAGLLAFWRGSGAASLFIAAYVLEKSLSVDNLMVFSAIFAYFGIARQQQPWILYWGFVGAVVLRFVFLVGGAALLGTHPIVGAIFGALVIWSGYKMLSMSEGEPDTDYDAKWFVRLARRFSTTPAIICLIAIEISDLIFAFDSMPAVLAVTQDPLIVYSSVMFAVLGLRSLYFVLDALLAYLTRLSWGVIAVLFFVGAKLLGRSLAEMTGVAAFDALHVSATANLWIVMSLLGIGVIASFVKPAQSPA